MSEWKEYKLGEVASVQTGPFGSQLHQKDYVNFGTPIITVEHLGDNRITYQNLPRITDKDKLRLKKYNLQVGDVVFSRVGSVDRRALVTKHEVGWLFSGRCLRVRANEKKSNGAFLSYYFGQESFKKHVRQIAVGATMPSINTSILSEIVIRIPDLPTQTAIAEILSSLDDKIELNNKINQELEDLAQTLFKRWFIDFEFPNENGDPYKSSGGEMVDSELGEIPKGWGVKSLDEIAELIRGISYRKHELVSKDDGVPFVNLKCFALDGTFRQDGLKYFKGKFKDSHVIQSNDILVAVTDLTQDRLVIGLPIVWQNEDIALPSLDVCIIRPQQKILKDFLLYEFRTHRYKSRIIEFANGSTVLHLSVKGLETYGIRIPSNDLVIQWCEIISPILKSIGENTKENIQLTTLRDTLLPKLISGELELSQIQNIP